LRIAHIQRFPTPRALSNAKTNMIFFPIIPKGYLPGITMKGGKIRDATILENGVSLISWLSISIPPNTLRKNLGGFFLKAMIYPSAGRS